jgi:hypothetical protein
LNKEITYLYGNCQSVNDTNNASNSFGKSKYFIRKSNEELELAVSSSGGGAIPVRHS